MHALRLRRAINQNAEWARQAAGALSQHILRNCCGDKGIHRIAAIGENALTDLARLGMVSNDDAVLRGGQLLRRGKERADLRNGIAAETRELPAGSQDLLPLPSNVVSSASTSALIYQNRFATNRVAAEL